MELTQLHRNYFRCILLENTSTLKTFENTLKQHYRVYKKRIVNSLLVKYELNLMRLSSRLYLFL